ncbi:MAG: hypothetical protein FWB96_06940 [Defluviitaleaceae bacterium]|nr:hypothetical protein [Defluviitaleaceae bacterium]MCL2262995.1 hypothetical protein [Defluviitaleaceae bacterium]
MKKANYTIAENNDPSMELRSFGATLDNKNNAVLTWEWPQNRLIKLLFIFEWADDSTEAPEIESLINENYPHEVVTRELATKFSKGIEKKSKFIAAAGYFNEDKGITICKPVTATDWLFKKVTLTATVTRKAVPLSPFEKATIRVTADDFSQMGMATQILKYAVYEQGRKVGEYPLDTLSCAGACGFYVKKEQAVKFILDENYLHLFQLSSQNGG